MSLYLRGWCLYWLHYLVRIDDVQKNLVAFGAICSNFVGLRDKGGSRPEKEQSHDCMSDQEYI